MPSFLLGNGKSVVAQTLAKNLRPFDAVTSLEAMFGQLNTSEMISKATELVFRLPSVGSKMFLITIGDRTVGGLTVRDQLVGPWQTPVADVAVTLTSFNLDDKSRTGEAMAMGEKPTLVRSPLLETNHSHCLFRLHQHSAGNGSSADSKTVI